MEKLTVTVANLNVVYHVAMGLGFNLNAFLRCYIMPIFHRIKNPSPLPFLCKFIKNMKGGKGNRTKLCMLSQRLYINILNNKNSIFNFTLAFYCCMVKKVTLVSMFNTTATLIEFGSS